MPQRRMHASGHILQGALFLCAWLIVCGPVHAQSEEGPSPSAAQSHRGVDTTLKGCLSGGAKRLEFATSSQDWFLLTGKTAGLEKYVGREVTLRGTRVDDIPGKEWTGFSSFIVSKLAGVSARRTPKLDGSFANAASWKTERNDRDGVKFKHPAAMNAVEAGGPMESAGEADFVTQGGAEMVANFAIPATAYASTNFLGGFLTIYVNRQLTNRGSCMQFGQSQGEPPVSYAASSLTYTMVELGSVWAGRGYSDYKFHTFQNGLCYEVGLEVSSFDSYEPEVDCKIPHLSTGDNLDLIKALIDAVSYFPPAVKPEPTSASHAVPQVTEFTANSQTADELTNRGQIAFSWKTQDADYVEFSYTCLDPTNVEDGGISDLVISEGGPNRYCQNIKLVLPSTGPINHSPNSSAGIGFGYFDHDDPTSVIVTITPYSHGEAYPRSSKSITVAVNPYSPFPRGVPTGTRNMTLAYAPAADGSANYAQGSPLTITWTDERALDPCVNLYLVQDNPPNGERYLLHINGKREIGCLAPASRGSYTWMVSTKFLGSGFRVLARTPGGISGTTGAPFNIVKKPANSVQ